MIWITGKIHTSFADYLERNNIPYGLIVDTRVRSLPESATQVVKLDLDNNSLLSQQLSQLPIPDVSAVMVAGYENYIVPAAYITQTYGIPGLTVTAAQAATDKTLMRQAFQNYDPTITPNFAEVANWSAVESFMNSHQFPVMLKPASLMKSLLVSKSSDWEALRQNFTALADGIQQAYDQQAVSQNPKMLIEEFLEGSMHTVAGFVDAVGEAVLLPQIADCVRASDIGVDDSYLYSRHLPSGLSPTNHDAVLRVAAKGIKALGLTSCPVHIEVILTATGPKLIEIGARNGGYRPLMYAAAYGIDMYEAVLDTAFGRPTRLTSNKAAQVIVLELFPAIEGLFKELRNEAVITKLPTVSKLTVRAHPDSLVGTARRGFKASVIIILISDDADQIAADYALILETGLVVVS